MYLPAEVTRFQFQRFTVSIKVRDARLRTGYEGT
jgi:hypothetical protein